MGKGYRWSFDYNLNWFNLTLPQVIPELESEPNIFSKIVNATQNETVEHFENMKIVKLTDTAYIYKNHIRNSQKNIYINSPSAEMVHDTKHAAYYIQGQTLDKLQIIYDTLHNAIKHDIYLISEYCNSYAGNYNTLEHTSSTFSETININKNIFFCTHNSSDVFAHVVIYMYPLIYNYYMLKKYIPDLVLIMSYQSRFTHFLLKTLNITDYILIEPHQRIINDGTTYFANLLTQNFTDNLIHKYYYDIIVKQTLLSYQVNISNFPKKLLFLRNTNNIVSAGMLANRQEIVNIAKNYGYVEIDQTLLSMEETIHLVNNATHIICEEGGATLHLLWSKNIKSIILLYKCSYNQCYANLCDDAHGILNLGTNILFSDIAKNKKSKLVYNNYNYIKTNVVNINYNFTNIVGFQQAIEENENENENKSYCIYKND